jgi:hypothetical protein
MDLVASEVRTSRISSVLMVEAHVAGSQREWL